MAQISVPPLTRCSAWMSFRRTAQFCIQLIRLSWWQFGILPFERKSKYSPWLKGFQTRTFPISPSEHSLGPSQHVCPLLIWLCGIHTCLFYESPYALLQQRRFLSLLLSCLCSMLQISVLCMRFYDALFFLSCCIFTLQTLYFSLSPQTLSCVAQSLLVPGKTPSKYGRRGSAIGIGTIEEVDIYPFHIANAIVFPLVVT